MSFDTDSLRIEREKSRERIKNALTEAACRILMLAIAFPTSLYKQEILRGH